MPRKDRYANMTDEQKEQHKLTARIYRREVSNSRNIARVLTNLFVLIEDLIPQEQLDLIIKQLNEEELRLFQKWVLLAKASTIDLKT